MNDSGITSQYGFLFQRKVFVLYVLENMNVKQRFCFEGKDDVEIAQDEKICELDSTSSNCVQVKSGVVDKSCFVKVIGNWLLLDSAERDSYTLFIENELGFELLEKDIVDRIIEFVKKGEGRKKTSIANKVYEHYKDDINNNDTTKLRCDINAILDKTQMDKCSINELDYRLEKIFFDNHCLDIGEYEMAKKKRLEKFIYYINKQIDKAINEKKTYSLIFSELMRLLILTCDEINDHSYKVDVTLLKPSLEEKAKKIVRERKKREVRQLFLVDEQDAFVVKGIVNELFYSDFRETFSEQRDIDISNLEEFAKENYEIARYEIGKNPEPKELFERTTNKTLESDIIPKGPMYRQGCYIYLTGDDVDKKKQIKWGGEIEIE